MSFTDKLKEKRKYIAGPILATALMIGYSTSVSSEKYKLPLDPKTVIELKVMQEEKAKKLIKEYYSRLESANKKFNEYIASDKTLTLEEQENLIIVYKEAIELKNIIKEISGHKLKFPSQHRSLYDLLRKNLNNKFSFKVSELEEKLRAEGLDVKVELPVERLISELICFGFLSIVNLLGASLGIYLGLKRDI